MKVIPQKPVWLVLSNTVMAAGIVGKVLAVCLSIVQPVFLANLLLGALVGYLLARKYLVQFFASLPVRRSYFWLVTQAIVVILLLPPFRVNLG